MQPKLAECCVKFIEPSNIPDIKSGRELRAVHSTWNSVWEETFKQFGSTETLYSDALTRQSEVLSIFHGVTCLGILLLRFLDFSKFDYRSDSYFKMWSPEDMNQLLLHGDRIMVSSYLTVHPKYRIKDIGFSFRDVILDLMVQRFLLSDGHSISGITRREKRVHSTSYDLGATKIREDLPYQNDQDRVDLLVFYRKDVRLLSEPIIRQWSDGLFNDYLESNPKELKHAA